MQLAGSERRMQPAVDWRSPSRGAAPSPCGAAAWSRRVPAGPTGAADLVAGAFSGLGLAAFVLDDLGLALAHTPEAEDVLRRGVLRLCGRRLLGQGRNAAALSAAIAAAQVRPGPGPAETIVLQHEAGDEVIDVVTLLAVDEWTAAAPRVLVLVRGRARAPADGRALLQKAFALTPAEADVALLLAEGRSTRDAARARGITVGTLRSHIKALYAKVGVTRRAELVARLRPFR